MREISEKQLDEILKNENVLIDYTASWCGPCQMLKPILLQLQETHKECTFVCIDVEKEIELCKKQQILSVPTLQFYKKGKLVKQIEGFYPKEMLDRILNRMEQMD